MNKINTFKRISLVAMMGIVLSACTTMEHHRETFPDPNDRLDKMLELYDSAVLEGSACYEAWNMESATTDCQRILREIERLYAEFPDNKRVIMANAVLNYEMRRPDKAQFLLDQLLAQPGINPDAVILRSKIAIEEGNLVLARRLLSRQIMLIPDHAELYELQAAVFYFDGEYDEALSALNIAEKLGTPGWRLAYHMGLISEARNDWDKACDFYRSVLKYEHNHNGARSRIFGLGEHIECKI